MNWSDRLFEQAVAQASKNVKQRNKETTTQRAVRAAKKDWTETGSMRMSTLQKDVAAMQTLAKQRYGRLINAGKTGAATRRYEKEITKQLDVKTATKDSLERQAEKLAHFLNLKTSTVRGYNRTVKRAEKWAEGKLSVVSLSEDEEKLFWNAWDMAKRDAQNAITVAGSDVVIDRILEIVDSGELKTKAGIINRLKNSYKEAHKTKEQFDAWKISPFGRTFGKE